MSSRTLTILFASGLLLVSVGLLLSGAVLLSGGGLNSALWTVFVAVGGIGLFFSVFFLWELSKETASPQDKAQILLRGWQAALEQAEYEQAQAIVEKAIQRLPISYTQIPGIITYLHQGQFDKVKALAQQVIHDRSASKDKVDREIARPILGQVYCLLAEVAMLQHDFETAANHLEAADGYQPQDVLSFHIMAKFSLYQNDLERANLDLMAAEIRTRKLGQDFSALHLALRAWSVAQRHDEYNASTYIQAALKKTPKEDRARRAEIHLIEGYVERSLLHPDKARLAFEMALSCDPQGIYGTQARVELENTPTSSSSVTHA